MTKKYPIVKDLEIKDTINSGVRFKGVFKCNNDTKLEAKIIKAVKDVVVVSLGSVWEEDIKWERYLKKQKRYEIFLKRTEELKEEFRNEIYKTTNFYLPLEAEEIVVYLKD